MLKCLLRRAFLAVSGAVVLLASAHAANETNQDETRLEEVIVTAQKQAKNLQEVPVSVQVIGNQTLAEQNHNTLEDLTQILPGVHVATSQTSNSLFIRGIGSGQNAFFDQSVAMFVDDIYQGRSRMSGVAFLDLERIEVLKGPQSTFFGNNAIAGALNIVTKKPGKEFEGWGRALYGEFGQYVAEGAIGGPITDTFGARLSVTRSGVLNGWVDNVNLGHDVPSIDDLAGRLTLDFSPREDLDATLKVEGSKHTTSGTADDEPSQWANCPPPAPFPPTFGTFGICARALALGPTVVPMGLGNNKTTGLPGQGNELSTFETVLAINYQRWEHTFTSVSGFYNYHFDSRIDPVFLPVWLDTTRWPEKYHQFSQELRVASPTGGPLEYLAGAYYQTDQLVSDFQGNFPVLNFLASLPPFAGLAPYLPIAVNTPSAQDEHVYSIFGSLTWNITDRLKLSGGLRGSWVTKDFTGTRHYGTGTQLYGGFVPLPPALDPLPGPILGPPGTDNLSRTDHDWMPSAVIKYQINSAAMAYFSFSKGFKAGGMNGFSPIGTPDDVEFGPEYVKAYELGIKSKWFDDRVLLNLDVFRSDYNGLQVTAEVYNAAAQANVPEVRNAANSRSQGIEFEGQWAVSRALRLVANVTYLDSYYVSYPNASPTNLQSYCASLDPGAYAATSQCAKFPFPVPPFDNLSGQQTSYAPRWSGSVTASYSILLPGYTLITELMPYVTSAYSTASADDPFYRVGGYARWDGRLSLETLDHHWSVDLIGKNLTDHNIVANPAFRTLYGTIMERPRNVAVQFNYRF